MLARFVIKPSRIYGLLLCTMHLLVMSSVWLTNLDLWVRLAILLLLFFNLLHHLNMLLRGGQFWHALSLEEKNLLVSTRGGDELSGEIAPHTVVTSHCVVLCARFDGQKLPSCQVVFSDSMQEEAFRELRVRLRFL